MSGDRVDFVVTNERHFGATAIRALAALPSGIPRWALIGGIGVSVRLAGLHRQTGDLDGVWADAAGARRALLLAGASSRPNGVALPGGVNFDLLDLSEGAADDPWYLAHRLGLATAEPVALRALLLSGEPIAEVSVLVATAGALIAMKVHSLTTRRLSNSEKMAQDVYDILRLIAAYPPERLADDIRVGASELLPRSTAALLRRYFAEQATLSRRWIVGGGLSEASELLPADLEVAIDLAQLLDGN